MRSARRSSRHSLTSDLYAVHYPQPVKATLAVAAGGVLGTGLRLVVDLSLPQGNADFPVATLLVNLAGAFVLGVLVAGIWRRESTPDWLKAGLGPGLLGSFTTLSALTGWIVVLAHENAWLVGVSFLAVSVVAGLTAAALGMMVGFRFLPSASRERFGTVSTR